MTGIFVKSDVKIIIITIINSYIAPPIAICAFIFLIYQSIYFPQNLSIIIYTIVVSILFIRKLMHRQVKQLAQGPRTNLVLT